VSWHSDGLAKQFDVVNRNVALTALQSTNECTIEARFCRELLLGQSDVDPEQAEIPGKNEPQRQL
jgi:hypothetical protein